MARFGRDNLLDIEHPATGHIFGFSIVVDTRGQIDLVGPVIMGVAEELPSAKLVGRAVAFARRAAEKHRQR